MLDDLEINRANFRSGKSGASGQGDQQVHRNRSPLQTFEPTVKIKLSKVQLQEIVKMSKMSRCP